MKRWLLILALFIASPSFAQTKVTLACQQGAKVLAVPTIMTPGLNTPATLVGSYPLATATVYITGSDPYTKATLYSDAGGDPLSNPTSCDSTGLLQFFTSATTIDITLSGNVSQPNLTVPFTISSYPVSGGGGGTGLTSVGMTFINDPIYQTAVTHSPVTTANEPGPLTPVLKTQPAGYVLAGPIPAVPGLAAIAQVGVPAVYADDVNVTSFSNYSGFTNPVTAGNRLILSLTCSGGNVNVGTPTITDSLGLSWPTFTTNGGDGQVLSADIAVGGTETISATLAYGGGEICPNLSVSGVEVNGLGGVVNTSVGGALFNAGGEFDNSMTTSAENTFIYLQANTNQPASIPTIGNGPPVFNQLENVSDEIFGSAVWANSFTGGNGAYPASITVTGGIGTDSRFFMVAYTTGGTFDLTAKPTFRPFTCGDLGLAIGSLVCSPFIVLNDQPNTYTSASATQDFTASRVFLPNSNNATVTHFGELAEDSNNGQWSAFLSGGVAWLASMPRFFNPVDSDCASWFNEGGVLHLQDSGGVCGSGGSGTVTSIIFSAPLSGGTVTTTGAVGCPTCVVSSSPGAGLAHFAGATQTVTSSAVVGADFGASIAALSWFGNATGSPAAPAFNTSAIPATMLPSTLVYNNQSNTYSTGTQSFAAAAHLYFPVGASAAGATNGEAAFNSTSKNYVGFDNGAASTFASFATALAPVNANCVVWINSGGHIGLGDAGTNCGGGGGGSGTVTSFSAGNLSPLFTSSVATSTTTPALTFALTNAGVNTVFAGPPSGSPGAPSYQTAPTISAANMTNFPAANTPVEIPSTAYLAADTNYGSDDTTALQSAITAACTSPGGTLVIAAGQYKVTSALVLPNKGCHVRGVGTNGGGPGTGGPQLSSVSIGCFTSSIATMTSGTVSTANYQGPWIENIQFVDKTGGSTCGGGLLLINQSYATLTNVGFQGFALAKTSAPSTPALTPGTSGSLAAGTYFVAISDTDDIYHETVMGTPVSTVTTGASGSIALASHTPTSPMTKFNVYAGSTTATMHLITQGHATGTYTITALASSNVSPPPFDESAGYGVTTVGTAGGYGTLSGGFSNQNVLNNVQVFGGTLNGIVADRNNAETLVFGGNLNLASNTSGCGGIFAYGDITIHTEGGGSGSTRICADNYGGKYAIGLDSLSTGETGFKAISLGQTTITTTSSVTSGTPTVISLDSLSSHNNVVALGTGSASAITDAGTFNQKYDAQAQTNVVPFPTTLPSLTITGIAGSNQILEGNSGVVSGVTLASLLSSPPPIGNVAANSGAFTTLSSTGATTLDGTTIPASATLTRTIFSGTKALNTSALVPGACNTDTQAAAGSLTSDVVNAKPTADLTGITGFQPSGPVLTIYPPQVLVNGTISVKTCNNFQNPSSITPGVVTLNMQIVR